MPQTNNNNIEEYNLLETTLESRRTEKKSQTSIWAWVVNKLKNINITFL